MWVWQRTVAVVAQYSTVLSTTYIVDVRTPHYAWCSIAHFSFQVQHRFSLHDDVHADRARVLPATGLWGEDRPRRNGPTCFLRNDSLASWTHDYKKNYWIIGFRKWLNLIMFNKRCHDANRLCRSLPHSLHAGHRRKDARNVGIDTAHRWENETSPLDLDVLS